MKKKLKKGNSEKEKSELVNKSDIVVNKSGIAVNKSDIAVNTVQMTSWGEGVGRFSYIPGCAWQRIILGRRKAGHQVNVKEDWNFDGSIQFD